MPFVTDAAMQKVATKLQSFETREEKRKIEVRQKLNEAKTVAESKLGRGARRVHARALRGRGREFLHPAHDSRATRFAMSSPATLERTRSDASMPEVRPADVITFP